MLVSGFGSNPFFFLQWVRGKGDFLQLTVSFHLHFSGMTRRCNPCEYITSGCARELLFSGIWMFPGVLASLRGSSWITIPATYLSIASGVVIAAIWTTPPSSPSSDPKPFKNAILQCDCNSHSDITKTESLPSKACTTVLRALNSAKGRNALTAVRVWAEMGPGMPWVLRQADEILKAAACRIRRMSSCTIPCIRIFSSIPSVTSEETCTVALDVWPQTEVDPSLHWSQSATCEERDGLMQVAYRFTPPFDMAVRYCVRGSVLPGPFIALYHANIPSVFPPEPFQTYWSHPAEAAVSEVRWITSLGPRPLPRTALALIRAAAGPSQSFLAFNPEVEQWKKAKSSEEKQSSSEQKTSASNPSGNADRTTAHTWTREELQTWIGTTEFAPPMSVTAIRALDDKRQEEEETSSQGQLRVRVSRAELRQRSRLQEIASTYGDMAANSKSPLLLIERSDGSNCILTDK